MGVQSLSESRPGKSILRRILSPIIKALVTILAFYLLLSHKVQMIDHRSVETATGQEIQLKSGDRIRIGESEYSLKSGSDVTDENGVILQLKTGQHVRLADGQAGRIKPIETKTTFAAIMQFLPSIELGTFWVFVLFAAAIKFLGILSSMYRWHLLLGGQGIVFPFRHIFGSFLIGRFLGTFLPSTIGLDGYKLYDASRFSHRVVECTAATAIEKILGILGIFITFLVTLPLGASILGAQASRIVTITVPLAIGIILGFLLLLFFPAPIQRAIAIIPFPGKAKVQGFIQRVSKSAAAYRNHKLLLLNALFQSFSVHFCTAAMYFFTARAIGAIGADFWQVTFASSIQIFATVITPVTIGGEGIREIAQYYLLRNQIGPAAAIVSAALGFWAAEALTLLGGLFWWLRKKNYRPAFLKLDGRAVDLEMIMQSNDYGLEELVKHPVAPTAHWRKNAIVSRSLDGLTAGLLAGAFIGIAEAVWILVLKGGTPDIFLFAILTYGLIGAAVGLSGGIAIGLIAVLLGYETDSIHTFPIITAGWFALNLFVLGRFRLFRDIWHEQPLPLTAKASLGLIALLSLILLYGILRTLRLRFQRFRRHALILFMVMLAGALLMSRFGAAEESRRIARTDTISDRPNVIMIVCDALRCDSLGTYGCTGVQTPVLDELARGGIRFDRAYANASWTKPGFANIFSGMHPSGHKTYLKPDILPDSIRTLAERMRDAGYYTVGYANNINVSGGFNFGQGFDEYHYLAPDYFFHASETSSLLSYYSILRLIRERFLVKTKYPQNYYQEAAVVNREVFDFIDHRSVGSSFFLMIHYMEPHDPYFQHPFNGVGYARVDMTDPPPEMADLLRKTYYSEIDYLDARIGELFDHLKQNNRWDNTIVLLTADHGEEFYEHGGWWHGTTLYQEQIHIPMIWKLTPEMPGSSVRTDLVQQIDIAPTILGLCGLLDHNQDLRGRPLFRSDPPPESIAVLSEQDHEGNVINSIIDDNVKFIEANPGNPRGLPTHELFRLDRDPGERQNLVREEPQHVDPLIERIGKLKTDAASLGHERESREVSQEDLDRMKSLGYVEN